MDHIAPPEYKKRELRLCDDITPPPRKKQKLRSLDDSELRASTRYAGKRLRRCTSDEVLNEIKKMCYLERDLLAPRKRRWYESFVFSESKARKEDAEQTLSQARKINFTFSSAAGIASVLDGFEINWEYLVVELGFKERDFGDLSDISYSDSGYLRKRTILNIWLRSSTQKKFIKPATFDSLKVAVQKSCEDLGEKIEEMILGRLAHLVVSGK